MSKKFVEVLGGEIWIDSEANKGTTISFTIPISGSIEESKSNIYDSALNINDERQSLKDYVLDINSSNYLERALRIRGVERPNFVVCPKSCFHFSE